MKNLRLNIEPIDHPTTRQRFQGHIRLGVYDFNTIMDALAENAKLGVNNYKRATSIVLQDYVVAITSMKLRTFIHHYMKDNCNCSEPECNIQPAFVALERATHNKNSNQTAYLSLYGYDKNGEEVEMTHDHTLARCFGGANSLINTTVMCKTCNNLKSRIEAKMHNKTLTMLKSFLDEQTGEETHPQFLLERLRKKQYNNIAHEALPLERTDVMDMETALQAIRSEDPVMKWGTKKLRVNGVRLKSFAHLEHPHCQDPSCQLEASYFAVERVAGKDHYDDDFGYHLNMYGKTKDGEEVMFHHHHILKAGENGVPDGVDIVTICRNCKEKNFEHEVVQYSHTLLETYKGVSRHDLEDVSDTNWRQRSQTGEETKPPLDQQTVAHIEQSMALLSRHYKMTEEEFIAFCEQPQNNSRFSSNNPKKQKALRYLHQRYGMSFQASRFFRFQEFDLLNRTSGVEPKERMVSQQQEKEKEKENGDKNHLPKWQKWKEKLQSHYNLNDKQLLCFVAQQGDLIQREIKTTPSLKKVRKGLEKDSGLPVTLKTAVALLRHVGNIFGEGPYAHNKLPAKFDLIQLECIQKMSDREIDQYFKTQPTQQQNINIDRNQKELPTSIPLLLWGGKFFKPVNAKPKGLNDHERRVNLMLMLLTSLAHQKKLTVSEYWQSSVEYSLTHLQQLKEIKADNLSHSKKTLETLGLDITDSLLFLEDARDIFGWGPLAKNLALGKFKGVYEMAADILGDRSVPLVIGQTQVDVWSEDQHLEPVSVANIHQKTSKKLLTKMEEEEQQFFAQLSERRKVNI